MANNLFGRGKKAINESCINNSVLLTHNYFTKPYVVQNRIPVYSRCSALTWGSSSSNVDLNPPPCTTHSYRYRRYMCWNIKRENVFVLFGYNRSSQNSTTVRILTKMQKFVFIKFNDMPISYQWLVPEIEPTPKIKYSSKYSFWNGKFSQSWMADAAHTFLSGTQSTRYLLLSSVVSCLSYSSCPKRTGEYLYLYFLVFH